MSPIKAHGRERPDYRLGKQGRARGGGGSGRKFPEVWSQLSRMDVWNKLGRMVDGESG